MYRKDDKISWCCFLYIRRLVSRTQNYLSDATHYSKMYSDFIRGMSVFKILLFMIYSVGSIIFWNILKCIIIKILLQELNLNLFDYIYYIIEIKASEFILNKQIYMILFGNIDKLYIVATKKHIPLVFLKNKIEIKIQQEYAELQEH